MFIALACVAFAGSVIASDGVGKEIQTAQEIEITITTSSCSRQWAEDYDYYREIGHSHSKAQRLATKNMNLCVRR